MPLEPYAWSSHGCNALGNANPLLQPHPVYQCLGASDASRQCLYREWVLASVDAAETEIIRLNLQRQHALGSERFRAAIEKQLSRQAGPAKIGRPRMTELKLV